jgi:hypothetical protein
MEEQRLPGAPILVEDLFVPSLVMISLMVVFPVLT